MICFGVDAGQLCGVAHQTDDGERGSAVVELVQLGAYLNSFKTDRVVVYIEKAVGNWQRFRSHQGNANAVIRAFKAQWPRHNTIHTYEPRTWQASVISNAPGQTTKQRSLWVANQDPGLGRKITDDNESDARNILTHGLAVAPPMDKKTKRKK